MRRIAGFLLAGALSVLAAFSQPPAGAPARPLRERLLERALKGDAEAQFTLGKNYESGRIGLPKDYLQAEHWYREAANQGDPFAEASLGLLYNFGRGVKRDYVLAYFWYSRSASHLTGGDLETLAEMRDGIAEKLSPQQLAEARQMLREPQPRQ